METSSNIERCAFIERENMLFCSRMVMRMCVRWMTSFEFKLQIENFKSLLKPSNTQMHWMKTKALYLTLTMIIDTTVMQGLIAPVTAMLRKVMLYDLDADPHGRRIVLDFQRAHSCAFLSTSARQGMTPIVGWKRCWPFKKGPRLEKFGIAWRTQKARPTIACAIS